MTRKEFEEIVSFALDELPEEFIHRLDNVEVVVRDWPTSDQLASLGLTKNATLFGLYQGVPQTKRTGSFQLPDTIIIFAGPILLVSPTLEAVRAKVIQVVKHEIAHHFGLDDEALRKTGY